MAQPNTTPFSGIIFEVLATDSPNDWITRMCGFSSKGIQLTINTSSAIVPDCDNPEDASWELSGATSKGAQVDLSGIAAAEDEAFWNQAFDSAQPLTCRYRKEGKGYRQGQLLLTSLGETVKLDADGALTQRTVTLKNASDFPWTAGDPVGDPN